ncbi:3-hydroxyacyl-CoA dehydrogenase [Paenibacillus aestuarii]|uniref:3-hydroxyacyl-CoA dehydrogenase n=1 Tax=Paenibacillus aestuarii TaxID=516965 RepID=A0ABW0K4R5_9BACL|nr:3-hydroxyacyl-CoA dehydrogenase [Paenibacillus aestuarii]
MNLQGCVAVVTGGGSGLGEATVRRILQHGGKAAILDWSREKGQRLADELGAEQAIYMQTDVTSEADVRTALQRTVESFGAIHAVINCAGIVIAEKVLNKDKEHDLLSFTKVLQVNLIGTFNVIRLAAAHMSRNMPNASGERGVIISTASIAAYEGQIGQAAYSASKGGIVGMTLPIARELARYGIRNMAIAPGVFETPMFDSLPEPAKQALGAIVPFPPRLGKPDEYAALVQSIIENPMLNGSTIRLDGAIRMQPR